MKWSFAGPFGNYDPAQLQRGFKIYREVCSNCHGLKLVSFRNLAEEGGPGFTEAAGRGDRGRIQGQGRPNDQGEMIERAGRLADHFPPPFANELAARAANGGARRPTCRCSPRRAATSAAFPGSSSTSSRNTRSRGRLHRRRPQRLRGPAGRLHVPPGSHYNEYFPGHAIAMPPPLSDGAGDL